MVILHSYVNVYQRFFSEGSFDLQSSSRRPKPRRTPFVELPLGATEDRVTGTIDIERALKEAGKVPGNPLENSMGTVGNRRKS